MSYFFRSALMKAWGKEINAAWDEADHPRGKTTPESNSGSFAPRGSAEGAESEVRPSAAMMDHLGPAAFDNPDGAYGKNPPNPGESASARTVAMVTAQAYADAQPGRDATEADYRQRNLNYLAPNALSAVDAASVLPKVVPHYNEFNAKKVTARILAVAPDAKVWVGREMSPVLYITGPEAQLQNLKRLGKRSLKADEVDVYEVGHKVKDYSPEKNRGPVFDPPIMHTFDKPVLRLWWD